MTLMSADDDTVTYQELSKGPDRSYNCRLSRENSGGGNVWVVATSSPRI
jgi:hypothetical protein